MNRPIRFRGKRTDRDEFIVGSAVGLGENSIGCWVSSYGNWELRWYPVDPDSIAQFVGYDCDGREVYEGDTIEFNGGTYTARLEEYWDGDIPAGELCSAIQDVIHTLRPVRLWQESITHVIRIEGEDSPSLPVHQKKLAEAYPPFKTACERFIAAYQDFTKELEATK